MFRVGLGGRRCLSVLLAWGCSETDCSALPCDGSGYDLFVPDTSDSSEDTTSSSDSTAADVSDTDTASSTVACEGGTTCSLTSASTCADIGACSIDLDEAGCDACQGVACGTDASCDNRFPCVDGAIVIRGCCSDADCSGLTPFCGKYLGVNNVCVTDDDV